MKSLNDMKNVSSKEISMRETVTGNHVVDVVLMAAFAAGIGIILALGV